MILIQIKHLAMQSICTELLYLSIIFLIIY